MLQQEPPNSHDLRDCLNQHRGLEAFRPDIRYREDNRREHAQPTHYLPIPPEVQARLDEMEARHEARYNTLYERRERAAEVDSDEELEPFHP